MLIILFQLVDSRSAIRSAEERPCFSPDYSGGGRTKWHIDRFGEYRCCMKITCPAGAAAVLCQEGDPSSTHCQPCPPNMFQPKVRHSNDRHGCKSHRECRQKLGLIKIDTGTKERDVVCDCDLEQGYLTQHGETNPKGCLGPFPCPVGQELLKNGSCASCKPGSFKSYPGKGSCRAWTKCEGQGLKTAKGGTRTTDAECESTVKPAETSTETDINIVTTSNETAEQYQMSFQLDLDSLILTVVAASLLMLMMVIGVLILVVRYRNYSEDDR